MKKILLTSFVAAVCAMMLACGSDSGTNSGSNGGVVNTPSVGNTSAILQPHECEKIMQALPVQPELAYNTTYNSENEECLLVIPEAVDNMVAANFLNNLDSSAKAIFHYGSRDEFVLNMGVEFDYNFDAAPNQLTFELINDCKRAAYVANIPEKDSVWLAEYACSMYTGEDDYYTYMTQQHWQDQMANLVADGWLATTGCGHRLELSGSDYCFQKQINDYLFELGYGIKDKDMLLRVDVAFAYQKLL
jgi:hypothetical protein